MIRAVLDANVFVSATLSPRGVPAQILAAWRDGAFEVVTSEVILEEIGRVLAYPRIARRHGWSPQDLAMFLEDLAHLAILTPGAKRLRVIRADPADDRYLECAVEGEADLLVSGDTDLLSLGSYKGIEILTPAEFLSLLQREKPP